MRLMSLPHVRCDGTYRIWQLSFVLDLWTTIPHRSVKVKQITELRYFNHLVIILSLLTVRFELCINVLNND